MGTPPTGALNARGRKKVGMGNDLGVSSYRSDLVSGLKDHRSTSGLRLTAIRRGFELYESLLVVAVVLL